MRFLAISTLLFIDLYWMADAVPGSYITLRNLGCWRDGSFRLIPGLEGKSHYLDGNYSTRGDALQKCARAAWERGYRAFVLQDGGWCGSSSTAIIKYSRLGKATECGSNGKGGPRANQVYEIRGIAHRGGSRSRSNVRPSFVFEDGRRVGRQKEEDEEDGSHEFILNDLGCWPLPSSGLQSMEGILEELDGNYRNRLKAVTKCAKGLSNLGYETMAIHDGGRCFGVDDIEAVAKTTRRRTMCSHTGRGTRSSIQVYEIRYSKTRYLPPPLPTSSTTTTTTTTTTTAPTTTRRTLPWVVQPIQQTITPPSRRINSRLVVQRRVVPTIRQFVPHRNQHARIIGGSLLTQRTTTTTTAATVRATTQRSAGWEGRRDSRRREEAQPPALEHFRLTNLGCWTFAWNDSLPSLEGSSSILDGHYSQRQDAIKKCARAASKLGYEVFAVQDGGRCVSSANAREEFANLGRSRFCRSDGKGGSWVNQVYEVNVIWDVRVAGLGCYSAGSPELLPSLEGTSDLLDGVYYRRANAIRKCARLAAKRGFEIFALHDDGECLSDANARNLYPVSGLSEACLSNGRGAFGANEVYEIVSAEKIKLRNLGCWKDSRIRAVPGLEQTDGDLMDNYRIRKDAIGKCARVANRSGVKVFVLQDGGWCGGSILANTTYTKYGSSDACKQDGEGGYEANQVYEILN